MTPAARLKTCLEVLERIGARHVPMDSTIGDYMRGRRYIGAKDRRDIVERLYDMARAYGRLGWWLARVKAEDSPRSRLIAWLMIGEGKEVTALQSLFDGSKYAPEQLSEKEVKLAKALNAKKLDDPDMPEAVRAECPPEYEASLRGYFGDDFEAEMKAMMEGATLDLRVNIWRTDRATVKDALKKDRVYTDETPYSPWGLRAQNKAYLAKTKAFIKGWVEIQDEGSQLIALLCGAAPGAHVLDYCAGGGGKTLALASVMRNKGRLVAMDIDKGRLERSRPRFKKGGVADIIEVRALSEEKNRKWLRRQKGTFDIALTDVPCSGTGTWRRNPDTRWYHYGPPLAELIKTQAEILDKVAGTVKEGGRLIYATCSLLPEENEEQVKAFLARHPDFAPGTLPEGIPGEGGMMRLTPHRHGTDGFFAAVLEKKS